ncbi:MAG: hypothetical protein HYS23_03650 [Geobacter sp.]|nr:hypothetical protein [Geobacter sp.]
MQGDLGASLFKTWSEEQKMEEIGRLVQGYRSGVPVGILCKMAETIAGSRDKAREYLAIYLSEEDRRKAVENESVGMRQIVSEFMI